MPDAPPARNPPILGSQPWRLGRCWSAPTSERPSQCPCARGRRLFPPILKPPRTGLSVPHPATIDETGRRESRPAPVRSRRAAPSVRRTSRPIKTTTPISVARRSKRSASAPRNPPEQPQSAKTAAGHDRDQEAEPEPGDEDADGDGFRHLKKRWKTTIPRTTRRPEVPRGRSPRGGGASLAPGSGAGNGESLSLFPFPPFPPLPRQWSGPT